MGQECENCCTTKEEAKSELIDNEAGKEPGIQNGGIGFNKKAHGRQDSSASSARDGKGKLTKNNSKLIEQNLPAIIAAQSLIRGYLQRRKYRILKLTCEVQSKYFKSDEAKETLAGAYQDNARLVQRMHTYSTGAVYNGQWKGGLRHGEGQMVWVDQAHYEGEWQYNQACGQGTFFHTDGDIYKGQWMNNKANGFGVYTNAKSARYEGNWKEDQQHGHGVETWPEGAKYEGEYVMSKKEGTGKYTWADGSTYDGQWVDNKINGYGVYLWKDGRHYYGQWESNDMQGYGIYKYADGVRYDGQYYMDKKEGYGVYYWTDGRRYEGWWHKGKQHGLGTYIDSAKNSIKYGLWENGKRVKWFDEQAVMLINQMRYDFSVDFKEQKSASAIKSSCSFEYPSKFKEEMKQVRRILNITFQ